MQSKKAFRQGFTLIELLVVLGIITALSGLALSYVDNLNSAQRRDRTRQQLDDLERLLHGNGETPGSFLADMGRLPIARELNTQGEELDLCHTDSHGNILPSGKILSELWDGDIFKFPYAIPGDATPRVPRPFLYYQGYQGDWRMLLQRRDSTSGERDCPKVVLDSGWKGPYVNIQSGKNYYDGFGNDFRVNVEIGEMADLLWPRDTILEVGSYGEDGEADKNYWEDAPIEEEVEWQNRDDLRKTSESRIFATLIVRILIRNYSGGELTWVAPEFQKEAVPEFLASAVYTDSHVVRSPDSDADKKGDLFRIVRSGMAAGTGGIMKRGQVFVDTRGHEWQWTPYTRKCTHLRAAIFSPAVDEKPILYDGKQKKRTGIRATTAHYTQWTETSEGSSVAQYGWRIGESDGTEPIADGCQSDFFVWTIPATNESGDLSWEYEIPSYRTVDGLDYPQHAPIPEADGETPGELRFTSLTPGVRKLLVYGYLLNDEDGNGVADSGESYSHALHSGLLSIELKPGVNLVTVYLSETLLPLFD